MSSQIFRTGFFCIGLCCLLQILVAFANYLPHQGVFKTYVMMSGKCFVYLCRMVLQRNALPLLRLQLLFVAFEFSHQISFFSFLSLEGIENSLPKVSRKSGIYPVHLMLTRTLVASVRNPRKIYFLSRSNSILKTRKRITYRRRNTICFCELII